MILNYTNRIGEKYYFKAISTKKGKLRYYTTKIKEDSQNISEIPDGYEIYETPEEAYVVLRLKVRKLFTDKEILIINNAIKSATNLKYWLIDIRDYVLTIFIGNKNGMDLSDWDNKQRDFLIKTQPYYAKMRYIKTNNEFMIQRMCYLGSINDWINIDKSDDLEELSLKYCYHLDKESFFDLG